MKKHYFFSYCIQSCVPWNPVIHIFRNATSEIHPWLAIQEVKKEEERSIQNLIKTEVVLMHWREISEEEYILIQN